MKKLDHQFNDVNLLNLALTHRSRGSNNYERLEFLGDSILGFVVAEQLYLIFPNLPEGRLSRMRASLVRKETLAKIARKLELGNYLLLGEGELKSGGFNRDSILSDTLESVIGAIYLDSDLDKAKQFLLRNFADSIANISEQDSYKDPKSRLQEILQKRGLDLPDYQIVKQSGEQHEQEFTVSCTLNSLDISTTATAMSRRSAEQSAADLALNQLLDSGSDG